jgi:hypothetical protein
MLGPIFDALNLGVQMADYQAGVHVDTRSAKEEATEPGMRQPDLVIIGSGDNVIRLVGEMKTYWTFHPAKGQTQKRFLAEKLGLYFLKTLHPRNDADRIKANSPGTWMTIVVALDFTPHMRKHGL